MAWVTADAVLLVRTGNQRYTVTALLVFISGLLFFEKSAVIPFVAFTITALSCTSLKTDPQYELSGVGGVRLWIVFLALTAAWIVLYLVVVDQERWSRDLPMTRDLLSRSITHGIVPGLAGGPWDWQRWAPASPWATPPVTVMVLGWLALAAVIVVSFLRKERIGMLWVVAVCYAVACQIPIYLMRSSKFTALELAQTLRYFPDLVVVMALLAAVGFCAPNRERSRWLDASPTRAAVTVTAALAFVVSSLYSTATFTTIWQDNPAQPYLQNAASRPRQGAPSVRRPDARPGGRPAYPATGGSTGEPGQPHVRAVARPSRIRKRHNRTADARQPRPPGRRQGHMGTHHRAGDPTPKCGYLVQPDFPVRMPLDGPLLPADWTAEINYLANSEGSMMLSLSEGPETKVPVHPGLNRVFVRLPGAGNAINVRAKTAALSVCVASGPVGYIAPV